MVIDQVELKRLVGEALAHLYEPAFLLTHPLAQLLVDARLIHAPEQLPRYLTAAIDDLRPPGAVPHGAPGWRQYRYLHLRYVEAEGHRQIAADLDLSTRQATREHENGLQALSRLLWSRCRDTEAVHRPESPPDAGPPLAGPNPLDLGVPEPVEPVRLRGAVALAMSTLLRPAEAGGVHFCSMLGDETPAVMVGKLAFRHVLLNVLGYLIQRAAPGARVEVVASERPGVVDLSLSLDHVRPERREGESDWSGLGLARQLAALQGVQLDLHGTDSLEAVLTIPTRRGRTVLYVDDNPDMGRLFRQYLAGSAYGLVHVRTAERALTVARSAPPDVIVLDVILPNQDGWQLLERLRADQTTAETPVIMCSVLPEETLAASLGVVEFLAKPISQPALLAALDRCCPAR